jgi:hypothetical protein
MIQFVLIVLGLVAAVALLVWTLLRKEKGIDMPRAEVAKAIEDFIEGRSSDEEWDGFLVQAIAEPGPDSIRKKCRQIFSEKSGVVDGHYRREKDVQMLHGFIAELRSPNQPPQTTTGSSAPGRV